MSKDKFEVLGTDVIRGDGYSKVTGDAKFADDYRFVDLHYAAQVRINTPSAIIKKLDYSDIINDPELTSICDSSDIPACNKIGLVKEDQPIFAHERIFSEGDVISLVIAKSSISAKLLASRVNV